jgi:hypothetical protein
MEDSRKYISKFLPFAAQMRDENQFTTVKDITDTFNRFVQIENLKEQFKNEDLKFIGPAVFNELKSIKAKRHKADYFNLLFDAGLQFETYYKIGKITVDFLINRELVFEIVEKEVKGRREYLEKLGYDYLTVSKTIADDFYQIIIDEIKQRVEGGGKYE